MVPVVVCSRVVAPCLALVERLAAVEGTNGSIQQLLLPFSTPSRDQYLIYENYSSKKCQGKKGRKSGFETWSINMKLYLVMGDPSVTYPVSEQEPWPARPAQAQVFLVNYPARFLPASRLSLVLPVDSWLRTIAPGATHLRQRLFLAQLKST